jgi:flagellar export protein FliJ
MGLDQARQALRDLEPDLSTARQQVRDARSRARSLERLREHRAEAHRIEGLAIEQAELEELALARIVGTARSQGLANEESTS